MAAPFTESQIRSWSDAELEFRCYHAIGYPPFPLVPVDQRKYRLIYPAPTFPGEVVLCIKDPTAEQSSRIATDCNVLAYVFDLSREYDSSQSIRQNFEDTMVLCNAAAGADEGTD
jgi:hypothetical protein